MSLSISHLFSFLIHTAAALSCVARECVRVTAGVPMQQMNILIRRPLRWQKLGDYTLTSPFTLTNTVSTLYPFSGLSVFISVASSTVVFLASLRYTWIFWTSVTLSAKAFIVSIIWPKSTLIYIYLLKISVTDRSIP